MGLSSATEKGDYLSYAGLASLSIALIFNLFRIAFLDSGDLYKCQALLNRGDWLDDAHTNWQPDGCLLHPYNPSKLSSCFQNKRIVFVGDSITRQTYFAAARLLDPTFTAEGDKHSSRSFTAQDVQLDFIWDPFLNTSESALLLSSGGSSSTPNPGLLVIGTGLWQLRYLDRREATTSYRAAIDRIFASADLSSLADEVVLLPVQHAVEELLTPERRAVLSNDDIDAFNDYLKEKEDEQPTYGYGTPTAVSVPWTFNDMIYGLEEETNDGLHYSDSVCKAQANVLLNFRCNDGLLKKFPIDKTCCSTYPTPNYIQWLLLALLAFYAPLGWYLHRKDEFHPLLKAYPPSDYLLPLSVFNLSLVLIFLGDRTPLFLRAQKQYDTLQFACLCLVTLGVGLFTMKKPDKGDLGFLNRDQTDEWKGWMQIAILIYHYLGASKISGIYNPVRVLVAAYLFMTGYGHFFFYYKKSDYGFSRVFSVMVRLNLLPVALAYTMDTDWLSYYFSPLVSMWFGIIWVTMFLGHKWNASAPFMLGKIVASAALLTVFFALNWPLATIFGAANTVFGTEWVAREWAFRVTLDLYIPYVGMLAAFAFIKISEFKLTESPNWPSWVQSATIAAGVVMAGFITLELQVNKFAYNQWHPYTAALPVIAFAILRNATPYLRSTSSRFFMFFGQCSLETFIVQFHLWMAADTKGLLVYLPGTSFPFRFLNFVLSSIIFVWISERVAWSTGKLCAWICLTAKSSKGRTFKNSPAPTPQLLPEPNGSSYTSLATTELGDLSGAAEKLAPLSEPSFTSRFVTLIVNDLRLRTLFILVVLWILNLLYPGDAPPEGHLLPTH